MRIKTLLLSAAGTPLLVLAANTGSLVPPTPMLKQYCFGCHSKASAAGGINLEQLSDPKSVPGEHYQKWKKVAAVLDEKRMPPAKLPQPADEARTQASNWIRASLKTYIDQHAGDPGKVTVRRLTSGEYGYTIQDLTGLEMKFDRDFVTDSVGGEGFANFGDVQFMQDASLERYLQTAKHIAAHAVIGSGPLQFFADPGKSGFETSAITRINEIYNQYGFRSSSGEGGKPFGFERYGKAIYACWQYKHRVALGKPNASLDSLALAQGITGRFAQHIWNVLHDKAATFPTSGAIDRWNKIPAPVNGSNAPKEIADLQNFIMNWPRELLGAGEAAAGGLGDERALVINEESIAANKTGKIKFNIINRARQASKTAKVYLSVASVNPDASVKPVVLWRGGSLRFRNVDKSFGPKQDLAAMVDDATRNRLKFGADGLKPTDFATTGDAAEMIEIVLPATGGLFELDITMEIAQGSSEGAVVRCMLSDKPGLFAGRPISTILADPASAGYKQWKQNVLAFGNNLPANSHGEAAPSDKDPIPEPYDNTYNQRERDAFHPKVKYYRTDRFLYEKVLDDATRLKLNHAWNDLLASFPYHDFFLEFVVEKYKLDAIIQNKSIAQLDDATIRSIPAEPRKYIEKLRAEFLAVRDAQLSGQPGHVDDAMKFAARAWRRPLSATEKADLRAFYDRHRKTRSHQDSIRLLLSRILVSPAFLYRLEQTANTKDKALTPYELASRMSYFLWSSIPDAELERAAASGELSSPKQIEAQVQRMLRDPKARRMSTEFFGQWLGFYRFDQFAGVDTTRFPEFTEEVKAAMYDEATTFFEHIVRNDRPVREIFTANYTSLNQPLAKHYGVKAPLKSPRDVERVETRGGAFRLGAVLTATSAPLRTSPVKRGDWMLRRILGTPTPPPPANAGAIPADEKAFGGLTLKQKLTAHQSNPTCAGCHSRIDPLGFPFEKFDAVGRWRETYQDGKAIEDFSTAADKKDIKGVDGLIDYIKGEEPQVLRNMAQKMIGFALGRTAQASDEPLIEKLAQAGGETSVARMASEIVMSRQFRYRRPEESTATQTAVNRGPVK